MARRSLGGLRQAKCVVTAASLALALIVIGTTIAPRQALAGTLVHPIDPRQQTALSFPERSHWLQPWRAYLDTVPASRLRNAVGINYDPSVVEAPATARLLAASGFRRARVEEAWGSVNYSDRSQLDNATEFRAWLAALRDNGIRPLILLNVNHGAPGPTRRFNARLVASAPQGAREVKLDPASAAAVIPGRTGLDALHAYKAADILFTGVSADGTATLSKPLPEARAAGSYPATTMAYGPFERPTLGDGRPNPAFEQTLGGWLSYVDLVTREARQVLGSTDFDVEIWNELSFGSDFLDAGTYYDPAPDLGTSDTKREILDRTIEWLRDPVHGLQGIGIGDGFANQTPFASGSGSPAGLTAIDKHPYQGMMRFPGLQPISNQPPLDANGQLDGYLSGDTWVDNFVPSYAAFFPEYYLSAVQAETLVRDISPIDTSIGGVTHGRNTHPVGGSPPDVWLTETGMNVNRSDPADPDPPAPPASYMSSGAIAHLRAKATLRAAVSFVNKGASVIDFYAAKDPAWNLVSNSFFDQVDAAQGVYPGDEAGGETMSAMRRMMARFAGPEQVSRRQLTLESVADDHDQIQFEGDGTSAHPDLYNRDVVAVLPFQVSDDRFVVPSYVMTRDIAHVYRPDAPGSDPTRYDMPPATYRLTLGGLDGESASVGAYDPLTGSSAPAAIVSRAGDRIVVELPLTDSPRLLEITAAPPVSSPSTLTTSEAAVDPKGEPMMRLTEARVSGGRLVLRAVLSESIGGSARVRVRYRACRRVHAQGREVAIRGGAIKLSLALPRGARAAESFVGRVEARVLQEPGEAVYRSRLRASGTRPGRC